MNFIEWLNEDKFFPKKEEKVKVIKVKEKKKKIDPQKEIIDDIAMMHEDLRYAEQKGLSKEYRDALPKMIVGSREASAKMYVADKDVTKACIAAGGTIVATLGAVALREVFARRWYEMDRNPEDDVMMEWARSSMSPLKRTPWK